MIELIGSQLDYILFVHGLAFVLMAGTARALTWRQWTAVPWKWFGLFALLAGFTQWIDVSELALGTIPAFLPARFVIATSSGLVLLEFCRRMAGGRSRPAAHGLSVLAVIVIVASLVTGETRAAIVAFRYLLVVPGAAWAAWLLWREAVANPESRALRLTSVSLGLMAVVSAVTVPTISVLPASFLNQELFQRATGLPAQLARSFVGILLAVSLWRHYCLLQRSNECEQQARAWRRYEAGLTVALTFVILGGWAITQASSESERQEARQGVAARASLISGMLAPRLVDQLAGQPDDVQADGHKVLGTQLQAACDSREDILGVSLIGRRNGQLVYLADARSSRAYRARSLAAAPGARYRLRPDTVRTMLTGPGGEQVEESADGIRGFAVVSAAPGEAVAVVQVDLRPDEIRRTIARARLIPIFVTLLTGTLLVAFFMSERKMSESGVRVAASEQRYRGLVEGSPNGVMLLDREGRLLTINHNGLRLLSLSEVDAIGLRLPDFWPAADRSSVQAVAARVIAGERVTLEAKYESSTGRLTALELVLNPVTNGAGAVTHLVGIFTDVTERHRAQTALERSHRFTQVILGISARFLGLRSDRVDAVTREALREIGTFLEVDRVQLFHLSPELDTFSLTHEWCISSTASRLSALQAVPVSDYPWMWSTLEQAGVVRAGDTSDLPAEAAVERSLLLAQQVAAFVCVPVHRRGSVTGFLALDVFNRRREWPDDEVALLRIVADVLSNGLARKQAEEALRDSEQRFQKAFRNNPAAMAILWTENQRIVEVNEAWTHLVDRSPIEVVGRTVNEIDLLADADSLGPFTASIASGEAVRHVELRIRTGQGETRTVSLSTDAFELAGQRFMLAVALDMTARTRAEEALRESEEIFRSISAAAQDAIIMVDPDAVVTVWNEAAEKMFGYQRTEAEGRAIYDLILPEEYQPTFLEGFSRFRANGAGPFVGASQAVFAQRKDGSRVPVELSASAVELRGRWHAVGILRDITERLKVEEALWQAKEETDNANKELQRQVVRANALAEEAAIANASKSDFLANMSHEIRTPMNGIIGMTGLLLDTQLAGEQREYVETVRNCADSLLTIINDILDFSKIEAGKLDLEALDFDLVNALDDALDIVAIRAQQKGLDLGCTVDPGVPVLLRGDPGRLRQVLTNLLGNALKFTEVGEIALGVSVASSGDGDVTLRFEVRDTGIGIPADKVDTLFQPFTQVDGSVTRRFGGTGLGLSICRRLAAMMGGEIGVKSEEGVGSTFWFTARFARQASQAEAVTTGELDGVRVLGVDDNETNRRVLEGLLASWQCRHTVVAGGIQALDELRRAAAAGDPYRIALVDMKSSDMPGEVLGQEIKADQRIAATQLVVMTSVGRRGDANRFQKAGFSGYLTKPLKGAQLRSLLATLLGRGESPQPGQAMVTRHTVEEAQRRKSRLLLAEDNITNQKVAIKVLERMGHRVDAVANGAEAIRVLRAMPYDLVFMDVQMPEMDGLEATRRIRDPRTGVRNPAIPIVAMTAHAMKGDRERCLDAGMNDYVSKPISPQDVAAALSRWLAPEPAAERADARHVDAPPSAAVAGPPVAGPSPAPMPTPVAVSAPAAAPAAPPATAHAPAEPREPIVPAGPPRLPTRTSLLERLGGDEEVFVEIVKIFLEDAPRLLTGMDEALASGDAKTLRRLAHTLKGSSGTAGAESLQEVSFELEQVAAAGDLSKAGPLIEAVKASSRIVFDTMGAWVVADEARQ